MSKSNWDPSQPGQLVRLKSDPGKRGTTTGKVRKSGTRILVQVEFSASERIYQSQNLLELCSEEEDIRSLSRQGRFGGPEDLLRILILEKVRGRLTNIFYSMESSQTTFYAHQFKPILKFLNSTQGRLLIADEVGLGKTIESIYIWKELQVREEARRLLIICPAMLRQKWQDDLRQRFNITADVVSTKELLVRLEASLNGPQTQAFVCITSLEGIRQGVGDRTDWEDVENQSQKARLLRLIDQNPVNADFGILDLVIIDEAHYLRNPETAGHRLGCLIRDASRHLLLLTATPIQTDNQNLFNLLRLVDQDAFYNDFVFDNMTKANRPILAALRHLWGNPSNTIAARQHVKTALNSHYFTNNGLLKKILEELSKEELSSEERINLGYKLEKTSLLEEYITRSRKRDVLPHRVERKPQTLAVNFSPLEQEIYHHVSDQIRALCRGKSGAALFTLILRQRQMASSMVAALTTWKEQRLLEDLWDPEEFFWEDFGSEAPQALTKIGNLELLNNLIDWSGINIEALIQQDSKYKKLLEFIQGILKQESEAKFVIFAYFRGTLTYLLDRLETDGISSCLIMGGMGDSKWDTVDRFRQSDGPKVLLSSEVGSEGIDLQHCRFLVNYDLPWNPMRVEQRIGRIDRLGQKAESIVIVNFSLVNTVEDRVLERLYNRIEIFKESLGDLEAILGPMTEKLLVEFFQKGLTPEEQEARMQQTADAILKQRNLEEDLEGAAINFYAFSDYLLKSIQDSRDCGRWLQPNELRGFVFDDLLRFYSGTTMERQNTDAEVFDIELSARAREDFGVFLRKYRSATQTRLHTNKVTCFFDPKIVSSMGKTHELLEPTHPLIQWIRSRYESGEQKLYPLAAIRLGCKEAEREEVNLPSGRYVFFVKRWTFQGLRTESRLAFRLVSYDNGTVYSGKVSERIVTQSAQAGYSQPNVVNHIEDLARLDCCFQKCETNLGTDFDEHVDEFELENQSRCEIQMQSAEAFARRKSENLKERIAQIRASGSQSKMRILPALEGQLNKVETNLNVQKQIINQKRETSFQEENLAAGLIFLMD